jgi:hypothetical protein
VVADRPGHRVRRKLRQQAAALLEHWPERAWTPGLETGLAVQAVCEAIEVAAEERRWVDVKEVDRDRGR